VRLARSSAMQRREREGRLLSMNVMSASIANEISQPIGAMMAGAEAARLWLDRTPPDLGRARSSIDRIASDGRRASDVVASVRTLFRRGGSGNTLINVTDLVRETLAIERDELQSMGIVVRAELGRTPTVLCDHVQLQQVILNLIANAINAMSTVADRPRVLRVQTALKGTGHLLIAVEDSGIGIDRDQLDRIFEPFFTTKSHGMGLGLWLCRSIVEAHRGSLTVTSEVGRGSLFRIDLPTSASDACAS